MPLSTSGTLSFAQIAAEFGGTQPHGISEYWALAAMGVAGIPTGGEKTYIWSINMEGTLQADERKY